MEAGQFLRLLNCRAAKRAQQDNQDNMSLPPRRLRLSLLGGVVLFAIAIGLFAYRQMTTPTVLTVAVGSADGEAMRLMVAIGQNLADNSSIRLRVVAKGTLPEASRAFLDGETDLAVIRSDFGKPSEMRTIVQLGYGVAMIVTQLATPLKSFSDLRGRTIGVVGGDVNRHVVEILKQEYDFAGTDIKFFDLAPAEVLLALQKNQVDTLLIVAPVSEGYITAIKGFFTKAANNIQIVPIEAAVSIGNIARYYQPYQLPMASLGGAPAIPSTDTITLRVPYYLVSSKKLNDETAGLLAKAVMDTKQQLLNAYPILGQIDAPELQQSAYIPIHPGAAAYFSGHIASFMDKYGDIVFKVPAILIPMATILAALWRFAGFSGGARTESSLERIYVLVKRIPRADDEADLLSIEGELDSILEQEFKSPTASEMDKAMLGVMVGRLHHLLDQRRGAIRSAFTSPSSQ